MVNHYFVVDTTLRTTTGTTLVDIGTATIPSSEFTAGKKYLIYAVANVSNTSAARFTITTLHGTTEFPDANGHFTAAAASEWYSYGYFAVWTAVSGEGIKMQFSSVSGTVQADQIRLLMINLTDDLAENTDWFYNQTPADSSLSTTPVAGASITFSIPGDWLVLSQSRIDRTNVSFTQQTRINRSGEASSTTPETIILAGSTATVETIHNARVYTTTAVSNTFTEESTSTGAVHTRMDSGIFALNLSKFRNHAFIYTDAGQNLSATLWATLVQTLNFTPDVAGDVWVGGYFGFDANDASRETKARLQIDDVDQPATQTSNAYNFDAWAGNAAVIAPVNFNGVVNMTAATHTIDIDASVDAVTGTPQAVHRLIWAVSMELPGPPVGTLSQTLDALTCVATAGTPGAWNLFQTLAPLTGVATGAVLIQANTTSAAITLAWDPSVGAVTYRIYVGTMSGDYDYPGSPFDTGNVTTYRLENFPNGDYYFAVTAIDIETDESEYSNELVDTITAVPGLQLSSLGLKLIAAGIVETGTGGFNGTLDQILADLTATGTGTVVTVPTVRYAPALRS